jgi:hypothetical protein
MSRRWRRILIGFGIAALTCGIYGWFFGFQTAMFLEARAIAHRAPIVRETPHTLPDSSVSNTSGKKLSYFGYDFEIPWDDLDESKTMLHPNSVVLVFRSGRAMIFFIAPPRSFVRTVESMGHKDTLRQIYGDSPFESDYALWRLILETTPDKVTLSSTRQDLVGASMLLTIKGIAISEESGIFFLRTKDYKGFQWGNPESRPRHVVADLFSDDSGMEFVFTGKGKGQPMGISQAEINRVLQTVHKAAGSRPNLKSTPVSEVTRTTTAP